MQLMGISKNTMPPKMPCTRPCTLACAGGVPIGSITNGPERRIPVAMIASCNGPACDVFSFLNSIATPRANTSIKVPLIIKLMI